MKIWFFALFFLSSFVVQGKTITVDIPDEIVSYEKIMLNFDGSISVLEPRVLVAGEYLPIVEYPYNNKSTAKHACMLFNLPSEQTSSRNAINGPSTPAAHIGHDGAKVILLSVMNAGVIIIDLNCGN